MASDERLVSERFPRSSQYHPDWVLASASGGANALWVTEWLTTALDLRPGMRVLDLGCGRGSSSIFLRREFGVQVWAQDFWAFHSAAWWRRHWERTAIVDVELADTMPDGWQFWLDWQRAVAPDNVTEITAVEADAGRYLGYVRLVGRRRGEATLEEYCWPDTMRSLPPQYTKKPLLRGQET